MTKKFNTTFNLLFEGLKDEKVIDTKELEIQFDKEEKKEKFKIQLVKDQHDVYSLKVIFNYHSFYEYIEELSEKETKEMFQEISKDEDTVIEHFLDDKTLIDLDFVDSSAFIGMLKDRKKENKENETEDKTLDTKEQTNNIEQPKEETKEEEMSLASLSKKK